MKTYIKNGEIASGTLVIPEENKQVINAPEAMWLAYGWQPYTPPTHEPTEEEIRQARIDELKRMLSDSDYKAIKHSEGLISEADYAETKAQRQAWRDEINQLEEEGEL